MSTRSPTARQSARAVGAAVGIDCVDCMLDSTVACNTAQDYYNAAMIFQHGGSEEDIRLAHAFATIASALNDSSASNWLKAASWDRLMLRFEQPQWYGTQYVSDDSGRWTLYEVEPGAITDQQRAAWSVPSLVQARPRVGQMNGER